MKKSKINEFIENLELFLEDSETFNGITFSGHYGMPDDVFLELFRYHEVEKINLLDDYSNMVYLSWDVVTDDMYYSLKDAKKYEQSFIMLKETGIFTQKFLDRKQRDLGEYKRKAEIQAAKENEYENRRLAANRAIGDETTRMKVFERYGHKCLKCGANSNLAIDHVKPVVKGGKDEMRNYQVLCRACNSAKGDKTIDYRKKRKK